MHAKSQGQGLLIRSLPHCSEGLASRNLPPAWKTSISICVSQGEQGKMAVRMMITSESGL